VVPLAGRSPGRQRVASRRDAVVGFLDAHLRSVLERYGGTVAKMAFDLQMYQLKRELGMRSLADKVSSLG